MLFATSYTSSLVDVTNLITTHSERNCVDLWFHMLGVRLINTLFTNHLPQWSDCLQVTHACRQMFAALSSSQNDGNTFVQELTVSIASVSKRPATQRREIHKAKKDNFGGLQLTTQNTAVI